MPRFHFHIRDSRDFRDADGLELPDEAAAQIEAMRLTGEVLRSEAGCVVRGARWNMDVTDGAGRIVYRIKLSAIGSSSFQEGSPA